MNDSKNSSNGLLVLRYPERLSMEKIESLIDLISPMADVLGVEPLVLDGGADARLEYGSSALLERVCVALEEIAAQGRAPEVNVAEIAPQALNARQQVETVNMADGPSRVFDHGGLNSRG